MFVHFFSFSIFKIHTNALVLKIIIKITLSPLAVGVGYVTAKCRGAVLRRRNRRKDKNER